MAQLIAYHRVSTQRQGQSGLGLEAQQAAVAAYAAATRSDLLASYTEVESGRKSDRPELAKAIRHAKRLRATLVIAKLDRLARNVAFIANLMDSGVEFVACDMPQANRLTLHIMAAVAEAEAVAISTRVREALAAAKARGTKLGASRVGHPTFTAEHQARGAAASAKIRADELRECYSDVLPIALRLSEEGLSLREIGARLDADGHTTRLGKPWTAIQVSRLLKMPA
jgi:DNA invertase Pin-like site-specific DNA recombinase